MNHAADGFALVHQIKSGVDFFQRHGVGDEIAEGEFAFRMLLADDAKGNSLRPFTPPNAEPRHTRPVTN